MFVVEGCVLSNSFVNVAPPSVERAMYASIISLLEVFLLS